MRAVLACRSLVYVDVLGSPLSFATRALLSEWACRYDPAVGRREVEFNGNRRHYWCVGRALAGFSNAFDFMGRNLGHLKPF